MAIGPATGRAGVAAELGGRSGGVCHAPGRNHARWTLDRESLGERHRLGWSRRNDFPACGVPCPRAGWVMPSASGELVAGGPGGTGAYGSGIDLGLRANGPPDGLVPNRVHPTSRTVRATRARLRVMSRVPDGTGRPDGKAGGTIARPDNAGKMSTLASGRRPDVVLFGHFRARTRAILTQMRPNSHDFDQNALEIDRL